MGAITSHTLWLAACRTRGWFYSVLLTEAQHMPADNRVSVGPEATEGY